MTALLPGLRRGTVIAPPSKSHAHRLLIANFLAGVRMGLAEQSGDSDDICATKRCLRTLAESTPTPTLDCGESGSTLRFLAPVAAALGKRPEWVRRGRLAERPFRVYDELKGGRHALPGDVSSQFVTGLLFALPMLKDDSQIRFTTPLESRGYVDLTLDVIRSAGIAVHAQEDGFDIPGGQTFKSQPMQVEGDWSGAAFWLAMNALGSAVTVRGLNENSAQPDRAIVDALRALRQTPAVLDVRAFPDSFPVLSVVAAAQDGFTRFTGIRRLRLKECDRVAAMADVLGRLGRTVEVSETTFVVRGSSAPFKGGEFVSFGDHRVAMSIAVAATRAAESILLDNIACADKSYPGFFATFLRGEF